MTDDLDSLERQLRGLRPRSPSAALRQAIARELARPAAVPGSPRRAWRAWPWGNAVVAGGLLAGAVLAAWVGPPSAVGRTPVGPDFVPVEARRYLLGADEEGVVTLADGTLARQVREVFVDQLTWQRAGDGATFEISLPREEVRLRQLALY